MGPLTAVITGAGAPGISGTLYSLKNNFDHRTIRTIGTDMEPDAIGRYLCDGFYRIEKPDHAEYLPGLLDICEKEEADVILPQNTAELQALAENREQFRKNGTAILVSGPDAIKTANNKALLLERAGTCDVPVPSFYRVSTFAQLEKNAHTLGWPEKRVVVKPPVSNGMRGVRIIYEKTDLKKMFYTEKPGSLFCTMSQLYTILGDTFPELIVMEYLQNEEYTVDVLNVGQICAVPRKRERIKMGITFSGVTENHPKIIEYSCTLAKNIGLDFAFGFQFKFDENNTPKLLECNPRIQGTMVLSTLSGANVIYGAVKAAVGESVPMLYPVWGTRLQRYWGGLGIRDDSVFGTL